MLTELRRAFTSLGRNPGFTAIAVGTLGLGIGANVAVLSLLATFLTKNAPGVAAPDRLVVLCRTTTGLGFDGFSYPDYRDYRDLNQSFSGLAAYANTAFSVNDGDTPERLEGAVVSTNYFSVLGVAAAFGEPPDETVVISHRLWQRRYGGSPEVVGETVRLNGRLYTVSGIAPDTFQGTELDSPVDLWVPVAETSDSARPDPWSDPRNRHDAFLVVIGRIKTGVAIAQARAEVGTIGRQLELEYPAIYTDEQKRHPVTLDQRTALNPLARGIVAVILSILQCAVAFVLVIAGVNVAHLLLVRATVRTKEIAVRAALGAGRGRLVGQILVESLLVSLGGGAVGILLGTWIFELLLLLMPDLRLIQPTLNWSVAGFAILLAILTGCLTAVLPALHQSRTSVAIALKGTVHGGSASRVGVRGLLVAAEMSLAVIVLIGAGLLVGSARNLAAVDKGFSSDHVMVMSIDPARLGYEADRRQRLYRELFASLNEMPGVTAATLAGKTALQADFLGTWVADGLENQTGARFEAGGDVIAPRYFEVLRIPLTAGRDFTERDTPASPRVAIVNETLASRIWPDENPLGKRLRRAGMGIGPPVEVVGVARDARQLKLEEAPVPCVYLPLSQQGADDVRIHIRVAGGGNAIVPAVQGAIRALDRDLPVYDVESLDDHIDSELALLRSFAWIVTAFGALAVVLATIGLYVVMSYSVAQRTREVGLRMALGASRAGVLSLILRQSMAPVLLGLAAGIPAALALTGVLREALFGLSTADPTTYASASILLALAALAAAVIPARRAARIDPMTAMREP